MTDKTQAPLPVTPEAEEYDAAGYTKSMRELLDGLGGYQNVFNAIADATSVYAEGVGVNIGVRAFIRSITPHRISHSLPGDVGMREALAAICAAQKVEPYRGWNLTELNAATDRARELLGLPSIRDLNPDIAAMQDKVAANRDSLLSLLGRAALTPSALSGDAGEGEA